MPWKAVPAASLSKTPRRVFQGTDTMDTNSIKDMAQQDAGPNAGMDRFVKAKQAELARLRTKEGAPRPVVLERPPFAGAIMGASAGPLPVIAEYKRASPSKGRICDAVSVTDAVTAYAGHGASALSILTEEQYFDGSLDYIELARRTLDDQGFGSVPILRKDFLFDPLQVEATAATRASAFLLIVRMLPDAAALRDLRLLGEKYGLEAVVEVFDGDDLERARTAGAKIIQVNARDLVTFRVDRKLCLDLLQKAGKRDGEAWVAASGMEEHAHLLEARAAGFDAALVGTALMRHGTPGIDLDRLLKGPGHDEAVKSEAGHVL